METTVAKKVLIPANTPIRATLENVLHDEGWQSLCYGNMKEAQEALSQGDSPPIVVVMPDEKFEDGDFLRTLRKLQPNAFVIGIGSRLLKSGLDAVLRDACSPEEVATAVQHGAGILGARATELSLRNQLIEIEKQRREQAEQIKSLGEECLKLRKWAHAAEEQAIRDELTDLYNRRYFLQAAESEIERARRTKGRLAVAMIDIDHFKQFNDAFGHVRGDELLMRFARVMLSNLRRIDTVARYGGEEFILLLPETRETGKTTFDPVRAVERLRQAVEKDASLNSASTNRAPITISAGIVHYPTDGETVAALIQEVDNRLFRAKGAGRNRVCAVGA